MTAKYQLGFQKVSSVAISFVILAFLGLQFYSAQHLRVFWQKFRTLQPAYRLLEPSNPEAFWPFIDYPMYSYAKRAGSKINQYRAIAILEDGREVRIVPESLELNYWIFMYGFITALRQENQEDIANFVRQYETLNDEKLAGIRFENHPLILSKETVTPGSPEILSTIHLED